MLQLRLIRTMVHTNNKLSLKIVPSLPHFFKLLRALAALYIKFN